MIAVAYGGPMIGAFLLPARVPAVVDFVLPMLIAVCEFMLFTVLGHRIIQLTTPCAVLVGWWCTLAMFSLVALLQVRRAHSLISNADRSAAVNNILSYQLKRLRSNMVGASTVTLLAAFGAGYYALVARPSLLCSYVLAAASIFVHAGGLAAHSKTAKGLQDSLTQMPEEPTTSAQTFEGSAPA